MKAAPLPLEVTMEQLQGLVERTKAVLSDEEYTQLKRAVETLGYLTQLVEDRKTTIERLRRILFGATTEKTRNVFEQPHPQEAGKEGEEPSENNGSKKHRPGHGRNGISSYSGAAKVRVNHGSLKTGDACPGCLKGKVYACVPPGVLVRVVGQAPLGATVWELEKLRCNLCGEVFTADAPEGVGSEKYDASAGAMIALLKYGSGMPFHRINVLQESVGIALAASTQWGIIKEVAAIIEPALGELLRQAAQGEVIYNDDTTAKVLSLMKERAQADPSNKERSGVFTSGIVSTREGCQIALYFTGHKHAGENLAELLKSRAAQLGPPIQMCDALSRNPPKEFKVILANCIAHGRRKFVDVATNFPTECLYVLETLAKVYRNDATARKEAMTPEERLAFHKEQSAPLMEGLQKWFQEQIVERNVEPNSGLGQAITYFQKHWEKLTRFLHVPGAPLDNNVCERALKKAILHRKNALFFKTPRGAHVGDLFMSLIHTCQLCGANPFDYLTELQRHASDLSLGPHDWMPWNYRETIERLASTRDGPA